MSREAGYDEPTAWIIMADIFAGFLAILFVILLVRIPELRPPPVARDRFARELAKDAAVTGGMATVDASGFASVRVIYQAGLLFPTCEWTLLQGGEDMVIRHARTLTNYSNDVSR